MRHEIAESAEIVYTVLPAALMNDLGSVQRLNAQVREEVLLRARKGPLAAFSFDIGGLIQVDVRPAKAGTVNIDASRTRLTVQPATGTNNKPASEGLFSLRMVYPDDRVDGRLDFLVGIDDIVSGVKAALLMLTTDRAEQWARRFHPAIAQAISRRRAEMYPALILTGDPGLGKTEVAMSAGDWLARTTCQPVHALKLDLRVREGGHVGDLPRRVSEAWAVAGSLHAATQAPVLLVVDEADSLAQSRGDGQQHHEDRVGVNTIIQRMDETRGSGVIVFFLTNFPRHIDPAVRRRIPFQYHFSRPNTDARRRLLDSLFDHAIPGRVLDEVARRTQGHTPADLHRLFWHVTTGAITAEEPLSERLLLAALEAVRPTPSVEENNGRAAKRTDVGGKDARPTARKHQETRGHRRPGRRGRRPASRRQGDKRNVRKI